MPQRSFWQGKRVLLTGHSGFKGAWLSLWLHRLGADVCGVSLPPDSAPNLFALGRIHEVCQSHFCDIREANEMASVVEAFDPEVTFHLAAQSLVRPGYRKPLDTFTTNIMGTAHVLDALRGRENARVAVMVTTDKVYRNLEHGRAFREDDPLGGHDPYSASKAASEIIIGSYRDAFLREQGVAVASARAGNVIGGGDWSEDRLIPDAVRAWQGGSELEIRSPDAVRPWQHVLDPLAGYLILAERLWMMPALAGAYNFGPRPDAAASVKDVIELARAAYDSARVRYVASKSGPHEAGLLMLEPEKAALELDVIQRWTVSASVKRTLNWYLAQHGGAEARDLCMADIADFENEK
ncbi:MAG: CDP-glucose 4,6-dehydratase [Halieaceae bacterium]|jgi:CDP-glucose 4,6-dehydratase